MAKPIQNPHDSFFRETFSRREVAEGYLPPALAEGITWDTLANAQNILKRLRQSSDFRPAPKVLNFPRLRKAFRSDCYKKQRIPTLLHPPFRPEIG